MQPVRDANTHSGRHLPQHQEDLLADREDALKGLHDFCSAWRHGPEGEGCHHEGVKVWLKQNTHRYGLIGSELMCSRFLGHLPTRRENNIRRIGRGGCKLSEDEKCVLRDIKTFHNTTVDEMPF